MTARPQTVRSTWLLVSLLLVLDACASSQPTARPRPSSSGTVAPAPAQAPASPEEWIALGDAELASHRPDRFAAAIDAYERVLQPSTRVLSAISRVYAVWSQLARDQPQADLNADAEQLAKQARSFAERAARINPGDTEATVAFSDALRLALNIVAARSELDRLEPQESAPDAETLRVAALLEIDEYRGDLKAGRALAEQAVAADPTMLRTRFLAARCARAAGDLHAAQQHLDAVATLAPDHPLLALARAAVSVDRSLPSGR